MANNIDVITAADEGESSAPPNDTILTIDPSTMPPPVTCIFAVPKILSRHNPRAYKPTAFSIGPLHHHSKILRKTHIIKKQYQNDLVARVGKTLGVLTAAVAAIEPKACKHYCESLEHFSEEKLVDMLVLDGCFLIELFRKCAAPEFDKGSDDPVFNKACMTKYLLHDLMLLENQIPWCVLDTLFEETRINSEQCPLVLLVLRTFQEVIPIILPRLYHDQDHTTIEITNFLGLVKGKHILELLRNTLVHSTYAPRPMNFTMDRRNYDGMPPIPSATELKNRGVRLVKSESVHQLTIAFANGVLQVSPIRIDDTTEALFRNIIAFEQCSPRCRPAFTSYAILLDNLINTTEDLEELRREGIITYLLNPEDALNFFNKLYIDTSINSFYYPILCTEVNAYCQRWWPTNRAILVSNYFSNPWVIASTVAAVVLLGLTIIQTVYTMEGTVKDTMRLLLFGYPQ